MHDLLRFLPSVDGDARADLPAETGFDRKRSTDRIERSPTERHRPGSHHRARGLPPAQAHRATGRTVEHQLDRSDAQETLRLSRDRALERIPRFLQPPRRGDRKHHRRHLQEIAPSRLSVERGDISGHRGVDDSGDAHGDQRMLVSGEAREKALSVAGHEVRPRQRFDGAHAPLDQQPVGQAARAPTDRSAEGVRRVATDARELERATVRQRTMAGVVHREEGTVRNGVVELLARRRTPLREQQLVPVGGDQPRPSGSSAEASASMPCNSEISLTAGGTRRRRSPQSAARQA